MAVTTTTRFGLTSWSSGDDPMGRAQFQSDNIAVESLGAIFRDGTTAARPGAAEGLSAKSFYYSTTDSVLYFSDGTNWKPLNSLAISSDASTLTAGTQATPQGTAERVARADHRHVLTTATATTITGANSEGTSTALARADHSHALAANTVDNTQIAALAVSRSKLNTDVVTAQASGGLISFTSVAGLNLRYDTSQFYSNNGALTLVAGALGASTIADGSIGKVKLNPDVVNAAGAITFSSSTGIAVNTSATVGISANTLIVNTNSIGPTHLTTAVAGSGLSGGNGTALSVGVDNSSIEISTNALRVKASGITNTMLAGSISRSKLTTDLVATTGALTFSTGSGLSVNVDTATINIDGSNRLHVPDAAITPTKVNSSVYVRGTMTGLTASTARIHISNGANPTGTAGDILFKF